jgi:nitroreductase
MEATVASEPVKGTGGVEGFTRPSSVVVGHTAVVSSDPPRPLDVPTAVDEVIRSRRTSLLVDPDDEVPDELVALLIELATWAPNHKRTWPWRFTVLRGDARWRFGEALAAVASSDGRTSPEKVAKLRTKYARSPVVVLVWVALDPDPHRAREDRDAVAAATQNLLLSATSFGLANYWASLPESLSDAARRFAKVDADHDLVALVYLGWPTGTVGAPLRPEPEVTWLE